MSATLNRERLPNKYRRIKKLPRVRVPDRQYPVDLPPMVSMWLAAPAIGRTSMADKVMLCHMHHI